MYVTVCDGELVSWPPTTLLPLGLPCVHNKAATWKVINSRCLAQLNKQACTCCLSALHISLHITAHAACRAMPVRIGLLESPSQAASVSDARLRRGPCPCRTGVRQ